MLCFLASLALVSTQDGLVGATFPARAFAVGEEPSPPQVGDVDGDCSLDVVVARGASVVLLFGRGDGTFAPGVELATGNGAADVALGDLDGDGDLDLVVAAGGDDELVLHRNQGGGAFAAPVIVAVGREPRDVALADLDGDGDLDVCVLVAGDSDVEVLHNLGAGTFGASVPVMLNSSTPVSIDVGDADGDPFPDLLVTYTFQNFLQLRSGDGLGGFGSPLGFSMNDPDRAVLRDVTGDGLIDVVAGTGRFTGAGIGLAAGVGGGAFGPVESYALPEAAFAVEVADFDGDGQPDVVATVDRRSSFGNLAGTVATIRGQGGRPTGVMSEFRAGSAPDGLALADINGDAELDVLVTNVVGGDVTVFLGVGDGTFERPFTTLTNYGIVAAMLADQDQDDRMDVILARDSFLNVRRGNGAGGIGGIVFSTVTNMDASSALAGDLDGDGVADVLLNGTSAGVPESAVYLADGALGFGVAQRFVGVALTPGRARLGDVDGDGVLDVVTGRDFSADGYAVFLGQGDGTFVPGTSTTTGGLVRLLALGDVDGDGDLDVVHTATSGAPVRTLLGDGAGGFAPGPSFQPSFQPELLAMGDATGDGILDVAYGGWSSGVAPGDVEIAAGVGDGSFAILASASTVRRPRALDLVDVNLDARADLVVTGGVASLAGGSSVIGTDLFLSSAIGPLVAVPERVHGGYGSGLHALADFNGDANPDLLTLGSISDDMALHSNRAGVRLAPFCGAAPNSTGGPATLTGSGSRSVSFGALTLSVDDIPSGETVIWFSGPAPGSAPAGSGKLCVTGPLVRRSAPIVSGSGGEASIAFDLGAAGIAPGTTSYFQAWYRDTPAASFNFTNGLEVLAAP